MGGIYLNNAATSYPKPDGVVEAMSRWLREPPVDPGRDGGAEEDPRRSCRSELAALFGVDSPDRVVLLPSATYAINLVVQALLGTGGHVVTTALEHNSVLRPVAHAERERGLTTTVVGPDGEGVVAATAIGEAIRPSTRLIVVTHASNVSGSVQPVEAIAELAATSGVPLLIDASQTAGVVPLTYGALPGRVFLAFAGHKALLGPPGVGGLVVPDEHTPQVTVGGTGHHSESRFHPEALPFRHEAGTPNFPGIAGLTAGVRAVRERGVAAEGAHRDRLVRRLRGELAKRRQVVGVHVARGDGRAGIVSFNATGWLPEELGFVLRSSFGIITRAGLHCAPLAHRVLGTAPAGTVRVSFGRESNEAHVDTLVECLDRVLDGR